MQAESNPGVEIVEYSESYGDAFERLNLEWLEKHFRVESVDRDTLARPRDTILAHGGAILYACVATEVVGTVALKAAGDGVFELTKMAVTENHQGFGIGRRLLCAAVDRFELIGGEKLYLESNSGLVAALALYESAGFEHVSPPAASEYERADVYMVYRGS